MYYPHNFHDGFCWEVEAKGRVDVLHVVRILQNGFHLSMSASVQVILFVYNNEERFAYAI